MKISSSWLPLKWISNSIYQSKTWLSVWPSHFLFQPATCQLNFNLGNLDNLCGCLTEEFSLSLSVPVSFHCFFPSRCECESVARSFSGLITFFSFQHSVFSSGRQLATEKCKLKTENWNGGDDDNFCAFLRRLLMFALVHILFAV